MEALAILLVFAVTVAVGLGTWLGTVNRAGVNVIEELDQLEQYRETLQKNALRGQLERWDDDMMNRIADQLDDVDRRIAMVGNRR